MKKRTIGITLAIIIAISLLAGCGKRTGENELEKAQASSMETNQENGQMPENDLDEVEESDSIELFNSQGVYIQLLAEGEEELSESDRAEFLAAFGFEDSEPFYVHTEEDGYPFMELYFDEEREIGCGIRYGENVSGNVICGFAFNQCLEVSWHARNPFSVLSVYGITGENSVTDYQEKYEYDEEGRLLSFLSTGAPADMEGEEWKNIPIISVDFTYDDQGRLRKKLYGHSTNPELPFGTTYSSQVSHYDEIGRLAHTRSYITHGSLEGYYIYQDDSEVPVYYLELDHQYTSWPTLYRFVNRNDNWELGGSHYKNNKVELGGEADFLAGQGFTEEDLFFEYEYAWSPNGVYRLSLYCDEYVTRGAGLIKEYWDGEYVGLEIFTFDGCEQYLDDAAVGQFSVYSNYYFSGRETYFLDGETIDEYFGALEWEGIHSVSFDYDKDGQLIYMCEGVSHGIVDRFYFCKSGDAHWYGSYMLEIDHGWGVTLYKF